MVRIRQKTFRWVCTKKEKRKFGETMSGFATGGRHAQLPEGSVAKLKGKRGKKLKKFCR